ncbi:hypothetical protein N8484_03195 [Akkermansiaceae bacterium]|nr:hypothetical protein [Akkermansiaceae bacterium]
MNFAKPLTLGALALTALSCGSLQKFNWSLSDSGFDPLSSPGSSLKTAPATPTYKQGQWVETSIPNATFFKAFPKGVAVADKVLPVATPMKVVSSRETYLKVELDSGDVGYVPEIMVAGRSSAEGGQPGYGVPSYGPVPSPVEPGIAPFGVAPPPEVPGLGAEDVSASPVPSTNSPDSPVEGNRPINPGVAPPPEVPGITDPTTVD